MKSITTNQTCVPKAMVRILGIYLLRREPTPPAILAGEHDVSSFGYFQRTSVQEFLAFFASTLSEKTIPGMRQQVEQDVYVGYVYTNVNGLTGVVISDQDYPQRVSFALLTKIMGEFMERYPRSYWAGSGTPPAPTPFPVLKDYLTRYQNPQEADTILRVQKELEETKVVLHKTIESLLDRGEKLDHLVDKSEQLSGQSKAFYRVAKKTNACRCWLQ